MQDLNKKIYIFNKKAKHLKIHSKFLNMSLKLFNLLNIKGCMNHNCECGYRSTNKKIEYKFFFQEIIIFWQNGKVKMLIKKLKYRKYTKFQASIFENKLRKIQQEPSC